MMAYVIISKQKGELNPNVCVYVFYKYKDKDWGTEKTKYWFISRIHHHKRLSLRIIKRYVYLGEKIIPITETTIEEVKILFKESHTSLEIIRVYGI